AAYLLGDGSAYHNGAGTERDKEKAKAVLQPAADKGDAFAAVQLGFIDEDSSRFQQAAKEMTRLAKQGSPIALHYLALMYCRGRGVEESPSMAAKIWRQAAKQGHAVAQYALASCYQDKY